MVLVWDWPLRAFHWALAFFVLLAWVTPNRYDTLHRLAGYTVLGLIAFRLVWGFVGKQHSRYRHIMRLLLAMPRYLQNLARGKAGRYRGLNPAGAAMLVALLQLLAISGISGWMQITVRFFGVWWVEDIHTYSSNAVMVMVLLHVFGVLMICVLRRENLPRAMITGWKHRATRSGRRVT